MQTLLCHTYNIVIVNMPTMEETELVMGYGFRKNFLHNYFSDDLVYANCIFDGDRLEILKRVRIIFPWD